MTSVLVDNRISDACERGLMRLGFSPLRLPPSPALPAAIASHPDTLFAKIGNELITSADYFETAPYVFSELREKHPSLKLSFTSDTFGKKYPSDCPFNSFTLRGKLYARGGSISENVLRAASEQGILHIDVKQGYAACTTLRFESSEGAYAITADKGMARLLRQNGALVTEIENGGISLPPYEYGFIGGACGVRENKIYFLGDIYKHPSAEKIVGAITDAGFEAISLSDEALFDGGGLIFID